MAYNPFKNKKIDDSAAYADENPTTNDTSDELVQPEKKQITNLSSQNDDQELNHVEQKPEIIETDKNNQSQLATKEVSTPTEDNETPSQESQNKNHKEQFDLKLLESIPVSTVAQYFNGKKIDDYLYSFSVGNNDKDFFEIRLNTLKNKWYNETIQYGNVNAISLAKHITAIQENLNESDNSKILFISACKSLTKLIESPEFDKVFFTPNDAGINKNTKQGDIDWKAINEKINNIPLSAVLDNLGAQNKSHGKWKLYRTNHNIQITGNNWYNFNLQEGKVGARSFIEHIFAFENNANLKDEKDAKAIYKLALKYFLKEFPDEIATDIKLDTKDDEQIFKQPFNMPITLPGKLNEIKKYLHDKRHIPNWIINKSIAAGKLFAAFPGDWELHKHINESEKMEDHYVWACFLSANSSAAEMRAINRTDHHAKLVAKGSIKELGGFLIKPEKDVFENSLSCLEAAVDTCSYHSFYPGRIAMSCMGVGSILPVRACLEAINNNLTFNLCFDNDRAGNEGAIHFKRDLIEEIGEELYSELYDNNKINFFDLSTKIAIQTIKKGETFYFDVKNNEEGREAAKLFLNQLKKIISPEILQRINSQQKIKYINLCPDFGTFIDVEEKVNEVITLLSEKQKANYLFVSIKDDDDDEIKAQQKEFLRIFNEKAKDIIPELELSGKYIKNKKDLAKDWNEFFIYMENEPKFVEKLKNDELKYSQQYSSEKKNQPKLKMK